ncbi:short chain alcohol dehydrogenase [Hibiscus syriacus]|uniref:Short chain alcohol dehydrogenase n=1 Tax=Hibiscus syriacus TaxID=106335 RepID=A0A6A3BKG9_HIBSY|nr:short chain alcohol dehydrogenase [Hibiscus syriacus]
MTASPVTDTSMLQEPLEKLLLQRKPDCIVQDMFHHWAADAIDKLELDIPRIVFSGNGCFATCVGENIWKFKSHWMVDSKYEPFVVPDLPNRIELTRPQLPASPFVEDNMRKSMKNCYGVVVNSFYELEPAYVEQFKKRNKAWIVGPVSLYNRNTADKAERGKKAAIDETSILSWLDSKASNSVLYISFGSSPRLAPQQILEIAYGLQASNQLFIWVITDVFKGEGTQFFIGGFMTQCWWNSTLECVCCGVPMITWPMSADQFFNEKLVTDVLKTGVKVGSLDWLLWTMEPQASVGRDMVEAVVNRLMDGGEEAVEMINKARQIGVIAKKAVEEGGSSYENAIALIKDLEDRRNSDRD